METHTVVALPISAEAHAEITAILREAGYDDVFTVSDQGIMINMIGFALVEK